MSKGVVLGGYQISNALIAALLVASTTGAGVATDSFSGVTEGFDNPLSGPSDNVTQNNQTDDSTDSSDSDSDSSDNQDSSDDGSDTSDSDSDSSDSSGSDTDSSDGSDSDSSDSSDSEDEGGFLDDVLGGDDEQDSENQTDEQDQQNQDETQDNETDDTTDQVNETDPSGTENATAEITAFSDPRSSDFYSAYDTSSVPLVIEFSGENAEYEITLNGESYLTGQVSGTETVNQTIDLSETGEHQIEVEISQNGEVSDSISRTFEIASDAIQETGFSKSTTVRTGSDATFRLVENGESVADATVYLGDQQGQTDQDGKVTFSIPYQETVTLSTDYSGIQDRTFNVTQEIPEPEITLVNPIDGDSFNTQTGTNRDVTFEADVDISEDSGTASVMIDGSEAYTQDLSSGTNSISTTQALAGGSHTWEVEVDTPEYNVSSSSRSLTVNEVEVEDGLSLQSDPVAGDYIRVQLYDNNEPVEGKEITVNGDSIGTTDSNGEVGFEVPNAQEITVSASGYTDITRTVEGYTEEIDMSFSFSDTVYQGRSNTLTVTDQGNGNALSSATVYANGVDQGQTDSSGQITFTVPEENSVTVKAVKDNSDDNESFTAEVPPLRVSVISPSDAQTFGSYQASFNLEIESTSQGNVDISINGENRLSNSISSGENTVNEDFIIENSMSHDYTISVSNQEETITEEGSFTTSEDFPPPEIFVDAPTEDMTYANSRAEISYRILQREDESFNYDLTIDGREITSSSSTSGVDTSKYTYCHSDGSHNLILSATSDRTGDTAQVERSFDTSGSPPTVAKHWFQPTKGQTLTSPVEFEYTMVGCQDNVDYSVYLEQGGSKELEIENGTLSNLERTVAPGDPIELEPGNYEAVTETADGKLSFSFEVQ